MIKKFIFSLLATLIIALAVLIVYGYYFPRERDKNEILIKENQRLKNQLSYRSGKVAKGEACFEKIKEYQEFIDIIDAHQNKIKYGVDSTFLIKGSAVDLNDPYTGKRIGWLQEEMQLDRLDATKKMEKLLEKKASKYRWGIIKNHLKEAIIFFAKKQGKILADPDVKSILEKIRQKVEKGPVDFKKAIEKEVKEFKIN